MARARWFIVSVADRNGLDRSGVVAVDDPNRSNSLIVAVGQANLYPRGASRAEHLLHFVPTDDHRRSAVLGCPSTINSCRPPRVNMDSEAGTARRLSLPCDETGAAFVTSE